jgi:hypothetical protein
MRHHGQPPRRRPTLPTGRSRSLCRATTCRSRYNSSRPRRLEVAFGPPAEIGHAVRRLSGRLGSRTSNGAPPRWAVAVALVPQGWCLRVLQASAPADSPTLTRSHWSIEDPAGAMSVVTGGRQRGAPTRVIVADASIVVSALLSTSGAGAGARERLGQDPDLHTTSRSRGESGNDGRTSRCSTRATSRDARRPSTEVPSRSASRCSLCTTSSGTFLRHRVLMSHDASNWQAHARESLAAVETPETCR